MKIGAFAFRLLVFSAAALVPAAPLLRAQATPPAPAPTAGEVVRLSAFEVASSAVQGYATTSSTAASRIAVPVTELASSLITSNEQLIADTLAITAVDTLNLDGGVSAFSEPQSQETNKFSMRGSTSANAQRGGFTCDTRW